MFFKKSLPFVLLAILVLVYGGCGSKDVSENNTGYIRHREITTKAPIASLSFHPNGEKLAVRTFSGNIIIYDMSSGNQEFTYDKLKGSSVQYTADGTIIAGNVVGELYSITFPENSDSLL